MTKEIGLTVKAVKSKKIIMQMIISEAYKFFNGAYVLADHKGKYIKNMFRENEDSLLLLNTGDSSYFLKLLSLELYLKALYLLENECTIFGHKLNKIYVELKYDTRNEITEQFMEELGESSLEDELIEFLKRLGGYIVNIRYSFDEFLCLEESKIEEKENLANAKTEKGDYSEHSIVYEHEKVNVLLAIIKNLVETRHEQYLELET